MPQLLARRLSLWFQSIVVQKQCPQSCSQHVTRRNIGMIVFLIHFIRNPENSYPSLMGVELREGRWVIIDLCGKGGRLRTVAVPIWVKQAIATWIAAAKIETGRLL